MNFSMTEKILREHLVRGRFQPGEENEFRMDHVLMQDATGTMAIMQFEALGKKEIAPEFAIIYVDHNLIQLDFRNPEDHLFLRTAAAKYGIYLSLPGNGICHQVNTERFARPGKTLLGSDSHTPTAGAVGCLAIGAGGLDVALVLAGQPLALTTPRIVNVHLTGEFQPWVSGKDLILELLRRFSVKAGLGKIYEFSGPALAKMPVTGRAPVCNMITELGATSALFPSDEQTRAFLKEQGREDQWIALGPDPGARYDEVIELDLGTIEPLIAKPHQPDNVVPVKEIAGTPAVQVCVGSSVNSWYEDLAIPAAVLFRGGGVHPDVTMTVSPGSRQILDRITRSGVLQQFIHAGARILEPACGPCVGMGQAPPEGKASVRTFNRNFRGRSGTKNDQVYLASPATAGATALKGVITDPRELGDPPQFEAAPPILDDRMILPPPPKAERAGIEIIRGRNILPPPAQKPLAASISGKVLIRLPDNISTGSMAPDGVIVMADRSNVPALAKHTFEKEDPEFVDRARAWKGGLIVAGENYGQGSSREHAALAPKHLGVKAVLAKSFARIHRRNLISQGVIPLLIDGKTYQQLKLGTKITFPGIRKELKAGQDAVSARIKNRKVVIGHDLNQREREVILAGGVLNWVKRHPA